MAMIRMRRSMASGIASWLVWIWKRQNSEVGNGARQWGMLVETNHLMRSEL